MIQGYNEFVEKLTEIRSKKRMSSTKEGPLIDNFYTSLSEEDKEVQKNEILKINIIDTMFEHGYIPFIYNGSYGGYGISYEAIFLRKMLIEFDSIEKYEGFSIKSSVIMGKIVMGKVILFLGSRAGERFSRPVFDFVKIDYYNYIVKSEYDGLENISFDENYYFRRKVEDIMNSEISNDEKIIKINSIIGLEHKKIIIFFNESTSTIDDSDS